MADPMWQLHLVTEPPTAEEMQTTPHAPAVVGTLLIGDGRLRGSLWGVIHTVRGSVPLDTLHMVGPGMHHLRLHQTRPLASRGETRYPTVPHDHPSSLAPTTIWSRTIGALGGEAVWQRLVGLRVAVIGVGRTGSLVVTTLTRLGLRTLSLIDPDNVEAHNLGEMDGVTQPDIGLSKVVAIATALAGHTTTHLTAIPLPITADTARAACQQADVLICSVDNDTARLATAIIATLYHKVLIDLGTGIFFRATSTTVHESDDRTMGADVRLILPDDGCLLCRGNLAAFSQAVDILGYQRPLEGQQDWRAQRAGSLRTLNQLAAALGVQMLQDLVAERLQASTWAHLTFDPTGCLTVQYPSLPPAGPAASCALCARAGLGDAGLEWAP